uniref:Protein kinase domain-containing protein n=1 Tax=Ditylenchus dipsaci TaxID=166011 RepID=A0A915EJK4_9BILA
MELDDQNTNAVHTQQLDVAQLRVVQTSGRRFFVDLKNHEKQAKAVEYEALLNRISRHHVNVLKYVSMRVNCDDQFQLLLEYADGGELFDRSPTSEQIQRKPYSSFLSSLMVLEYIHSNGIVYRDIKPENLLLTKHDVLKISDFCMATIFRKKRRMRSHLFLAFVLPMDFMSRLRFCSRSKSDGIEFKSPVHKQMESVIYKESYGKARISVLI